MSLIMLNKHTSLMELRIWVQAHTAHSCTTFHPSVPLRLFMGLLQPCHFIPQSLPILQTALAHVQSLAPGFVELNEVHTSSLLKPLKVALNDSPPT